MALHEWLTSEVREGPAGPRVGAFFDLDGTLIAGFSIAAFWRDRLLNRGISLAEIRATLASVAGFRRGTLGFSGVMATMAGFMRGISEQEFEELGERLFEEELATLIYPESRALVETHLELGHTVAIISSATRYQIDPLARDLGVELVVCSELEVEDGRFTGRVPFACDGRRKAEAAALAHLAVLLCRGGVLCCDRAHHLRIAPALRALRSGDGVARVCGGSGSLEKPLRGRG